MNWVDYTIFAILFFATILGLASGPILQFLRIGCLLISFFTALFFRDILSSILKSVFTIPTANLLSYFIIFGIAFIVTYILSDIMKKILGKWEIGIGLRLFGGFLGVLKGLVFCGVIIFGVVLFCSKSTCERINTSKIASQIGRGMQAMVSIIPESVSNRITGRVKEKKENKTTNDAKSDKEEDFKPSH